MWQSGPQPLINPFSIGISTPKEREQLMGHSSPHFIRTQVQYLSSNMHKAVSSLLESHLGNQMQRCSTLP